MFTGIVEEVGQVETLRINGDHGTISIQAHKVLEATKLGDSIAVDGICLTVTYLSAHHFHADVMKETVRRSSLSQKRQGSYVNLERAMRADDRFGGHIVSGHIDGVGTIENIIPDGNAYWYEIKCKKEILDGIVEKGSITIDGISLTVANVSEKSFKVSIIPHTREQTTLGHKSVGDYVNLENDILGKYVQKFMSRQLEEKHELTYEMLEEYGY